MGKPVRQNRRERRKAKASNWTRVPSKKVGHHSYVGHFSFKMKKSPLKGEFAKEEEKEEVLTQNPFKDFYECGDHSQDHKPQL